MRIHKTPSWLIGGLLGMGLVMQASHWARGQEPVPQAAFPATAPAAAVTGLVPAWREDARLNAKISLDAKRMPLAQVLEALAKQSGVALDGGALSATKRVTLSVADMDAREVMAALEDLYQASWQAGGKGGYVLQPRTMLPWQRSLAQLGNIDNWGFYRTNWSRPYAPPYLTARYAFDWQALMNELGEEKLESREGVLFSSLPPDTQREIRRVTSWDIQHQAIEAAAVREAAEHDWTLMIKPENYPHPSMAKLYKVVVPARPGPLVGEVDSDDRPLASFLFKPVRQPEPAAPAQSGPAQPEPAQLVPPAAE